MCLIDAENSNVPEKGPKDFILVLEVGSLFQSEKGKHF